MGILELIMILLVGDCGSRSGEVRSVKVFVTGEKQHIRDEKTALPKLTPHLSLQLPDESRLLAISQLQALTGVSKGLTRTTDIIALEDDSAVAAESHQMQSAREDPRLVKVREGMVEAIRAVVDLWCKDAAMSDVSVSLFFSLHRIAPD